MEGSRFPLPIPVQRTVPGPAGARLALAVFSHGRPCRSLGALAGSASGTTARVRRAAARAVGVAVPPLLVYAVSVCSCSHSSAVNRRMVLSFIIVIHHDFVIVLRDMVGLRARGWRPGALSLRS